MRFLLFYFIVSACYGDDEVLHRLQNEALSGTSPSQYALAEYYLQASLPDFKSASEWLKKASAQGNLDAMVELGHMAEKGLGESVDLADAIRLYSKAASAGCPSGQRQLGLCYANGIGVSRDLETSRGLLDKAAAQRDPLAEANLAYFYLDAIGVSVDAKQGFTFALRSAFDRCGAGQYLVAQCYWNGIFVKRDPVLAYAYAIEAGKSYQDDSEKTLISDMLMQLSPEDMSAGRLLVNKIENRFNNMFQDSINVSLKDTATVPFAFNKGLYLIPVTINSVPLHFLVDTGSTTSLLDDTTAAALGISAGNVYFPGYGPNEKTTLIPLVEGVELKCGSADLSNVTFGVVPLPYSAYLGNKVDGIVGLDLLRCFTVSINNDNNAFLFEKPGRFHPKPSDQVTALTIKSFVYLPVRVKNGDSDAIAKIFIDTGDAGNEPFTFGRSFLKSNPQLKIKSDGVIRQQYGFGGVFSYESSKCSEINLGTIAFKNPTLSIVENQGVWATGNEGSIGNACLRSLNITIDFDNKLLYFSKANSTRQP